jgi:hypothetical protein
MDPASAAGRARKRDGSVSPKRSRMSGNSGSLISVERSNLGVKGPCRPAQLTILNMEAKDQTTKLDGFIPVAVVRGDACNMPQPVRGQRSTLSIRTLSSESRELGEPVCARIR